MQVCHCAELAYMFAPDPSWPIGYTPAEATLAASMQAYWAGMVANGAPGNGTAACPLPWPAVSPFAGRGNSSNAPAPIMLFNTTAEQQSPACGNAVGGSLYDSEVGAFWNSIGYNWY